MTKLATPLLATVLASIAAFGCRKHSWEENPGRIPPVLAELGVELDASGVGQKPPGGMDAEESVSLFFRKNVSGVAVDYVAHFEQKGFRRIECEGYSRQKEGRVDECFRKGERALHVVIRERQFPLLGTELKRPMAEVAVHLNPRHLRS